MKNILKQFLVVFSLSFLITTVSNAVTIDSAFTFRTVRSANTIKWGEGDIIVVNAFVSPPEEGGVYANAYGSLASLYDQGSPDWKTLLTFDNFFPNQFTYNFAYDPNLAGPWLVVAKGSSDTDYVGQRTNSLIGVEQLPFVNNVKLNGSGLTPTITWKLPLEDSGNRISVVIHDAITGDRQWWSPQQEKSITSYTIPKGILEENKAYTIRVIYESTDTDNIVGRVVSRTETFLNFTPLSDDSQDAVFLPVVSEDTNPDDEFGPVYSFDFDVKAGESCFIDPYVAIGYDYQIGSQNPLFASVTLPSLGDNQYGLWLKHQNGELYDAGLIHAGVEYSFGDGVDFFRIMGIEEVLGLDPNDVTAFITQLKFKTDGVFTGTMTPITKWVDPVPEPTTLFLLGLGLLGVAGVSRRKN